MSNARTGDDCAVVGSARPGVLHEKGVGETVTNDRATIRPNAVVYTDISVGDNFDIGHAAPASLG